MKICGIELKASNALIAVVSSESEGDEENVEWLNLKCKKIILQDDESADAIRAFVDEFVAFFEEHDIDEVAIKKRHKKGNFAGGPVSFKMEALIQYCFPKVHLLAPASVAAAHKKHKFEQHAGLKKYQLQAYLTACTAHIQLSE